MTETGGDKGIGRRTARHRRLLEPGHPRPAVRTLRDSTRLRRPLQLSRRSGYNRGEIPARATTPWSSAAIPWSTPSARRFLPVLSAMMNGPTNRPNNALRINGLGAPRAFFTPVARRFLFPNVSYGEDYAMALRITRDYALGRIFTPLYLCRLLGRQFRCRPVAGENQRQQHLQGLCALIRADGPRAPELRCRRWQPWRLVLGCLVGTMEFSRQ